jgi:hypothetical protein
METAVTLNLIVTPRLVKAVLIALTVYSKMPGDYVLRVLILMTMFVPVIPVLFELTET